MNSPSKLAPLSDEELLKRAKTIRNTKIYDAVIVGFLIGISIYSSVNNGFGLLTFLPLVYPPIAAKNAKTRKELEQILEERNLKV